MDDVKWIKVAPNIFENEKIKLITGKNADSILVIWFKLLCLAGRLNNNGVFIVGKVPYSIKMFADAFNRNEKLIKEALQIFEQYEMIEIVDGVVTLPNWDKYQSLDALEKKRERDKEYKSQKRAAQKEIVKKSSDSRRTSSDLVVGQSSLVVTLDKEREIEYKKEREKEKTLTPKHKHGEYKNVLLTDEEYAKLQTEYPTDYERMIDNLSGYLATKNVSYKSHYAVIRKWAKEDKQKADVKGKPAYVANNPFLQFKQSNTDYDALERELMGN